MFKQVLNVTLAASLVFAPGAASANSFVFRYKNPIAGEARPPVDDTQYADGNDVQAWFVAPVGYGFSKRIPVATHDVAEWSRSKGSLPDGLSIDPATGVISGQATRPQATESLWYGADTKDSRIARAAVRFSTFDPVGQLLEISWYGHTDEYLYKPFPMPSGVQVVRWEPLTDVPEGMQIRDGALEGSPAKKGYHPLALRGFDYMDREVAFVFGELIVQDGPVVDFIADQTINLQNGESFDVTASVQHSIGEMAYTLKPVAARPPGLSFNSRDGRLRGAFDVYGAQAKFVIEATDGADGRTGRSNEFTLSTLPEALDLAKLPDMAGVVGEGFWRRIASSSPQAVYDLIEGELPDGVALVRSTGEIAGTPTRPETKENIRVSVSGDGVTPAESNAFRFRVFSGELKFQVEPVNVRVDEPFRATAPTAVGGDEPPYVWNFNPSLPDRLAFDKDAGQFFSDGMRLPGAYDQFVGVTNASGRQVSFWQPIRVFAPTTISYDHAAGRRYSPISIAPTIPDGGIRDARYALVQGTLPSFLKFEPSTGVIYGQTDEIKNVGVYGPFVVAVTDGFGGAPVRSPAFMIDVQDRLALTLTQTVGEVERWIENHPVIAKVENSVQAARISVGDRGDLPATLDVNAAGYLVGTTSDPVGRVYHFGLRAIDGTGASTDVPASLTIVDPRDIAAVGGSLDRTFVWTAGRPFKGLRLPDPTNTFGNVSYVLDANEWGLSADNAGRTVVGVVPSVGSYSVGYSLSDETPRAPVRGTLTFTIQPPMTVSSANVQASRGAEVSYAPMRTNGVAPFKWSITSGGLPGTLSYPAMKVDPATGAISGKPRVEGSFPLTLSVVDATGQTETTSFSIVVGAPLPFGFDYGDGRMVTGILSIVPPQVKNKSEEIDWTHVSGRLPDGVGFVDGRFEGVPTEDGLFDGIVVKGVDMGTGSQHVETTALRVSRQGQVSFPSRLLKVRAGSAAHEFEVTAANATRPVTYSIASNPYPGSVSLTSDGKLSAAFTSVGRYPVKVTATDLFGRSADAEIVIDAVPGLQVSAPQQMTFKRFVEGAEPLSIQNLIGTATVTTSGLPDGISATAAGVSGTPLVTGSWNATTITAVDSFDGSSSTSNPFDLKVDERDQLAIAAADYAGNQYVPVAFKPGVSGAAGVVSWSVSPSLPASLSFNPSTGEISGSMDETFEQIFTLSATDGKGGALGEASATFDLKIADRLSPSITNPSTLPAILGLPMTTTLRADYVYGDRTWELVSGTLPDGVEFENGSFSGVPTVFGKSGPVVVRITDSYRGVQTSGEKSFVIDVRQDGTVIALSAPGTMPFRVGQPGSSSVPVADNTVGNVVWSATGLDGTGLVLDPASGVISGLAPQATTRNVVLTVADVTGRSASVDVVLQVVPPLDIAFAKDTQLLFNYTFGVSGTSRVAPAQPSVSNAWGSTIWSISPSGALPRGLQFDAATGRFSGKPMEIGDFGPFTLSTTDQLPGVGTLPGVRLHVAMNDDPISLSVADYVTKIGYPIRTDAPLYDNALGGVRFFPENTDLSDTNLALDPSTGVLTGQFATTQDRRINVAIMDEGTTRVTSKPLHLQVLPKLVLTGPVTASLEAQAKISPVPVIAANVAGSLVWNDLPEAQKALLPKGVTFDTTIGSFIGQADDLGVYGPFTVSAEDRFHGFVDAATSNDVTLQVRQGAVYIKIDGGVLAAGQKLKTYDVDLSPKLTLSGMDSSEVSWSATVDKPGQSFPSGLNFDGAGHLKGTPDKAGDFTFEVKVTGKGRTSSGVFTMHVEPPLYDLEIADPGTFTAVSWQTKSMNLLDLVTTASPNINRNAILFSAVTNPASPNVSVSGQQIYGTFTHGDDYVFTIKATYTSGSDVVTATTDVKVKVVDLPETAWRYWTIQFEGNMDGRRGYTQALDVKLPEIQFLDASGSVVAPREASTYYSNKNVVRTVDERGPISTWDGTPESAKAWDGNPSTFMTDGLGSGLVVEFPSPVVLSKLRITMSGTLQDLKFIKSLRSNVEGWCGGCGWLQHSSDAQLLPPPAGGGGLYAPGEVVEVKLYPGMP
jgi:hypothetical protein